MGDRAPQPSTPHAVGPGGIAPGVTSAAGIWPRSAVAVLFLGSGAAALIYELVWYQLLRYAVGASAVSLSLTLGSFMAGLGLGAWLAPRWLSPRRHPLKVYAVLELGIGVCGLAMPWVIRSAGTAYAALGAGDAGGPAGGVLGRGVVCALAMVPPAVLMGATLPVIARWVRGTASGASWLGVYYAINTLGATAGVIVGGFALLPNLTLGQVSWIVAGLNAAVAVWAWGLAVAQPHDNEPEKTPGDRTEPPRPAHSTNQPEGDTTDTAPRNGYAGLGWVVLLAIAWSGFTAMAAQVVWTRVLAMVLHVTVYTFSIILAVFLLGLALGGGLGSAVLRRTRRPGVWFALAQLALVPAIAWAFWFSVWEVADWARPIGHGRWSWQFFASDLRRVAIALLPATLCWGASLPLAVAAAGWSGANRGANERGRVVGRVYAANTVGAIAGALTTGLVALPTWGSDATAHGLVLLAGVNGVWLLRRASRVEPTRVPTVPTPDANTSRSEIVRSLGWLKRASASAVDQTHRVMRRGALGGVALLLGVGAVAWWGPGVPEVLLVTGKQRDMSAYTLDTVEGLHAVASVSTHTENGRKEFWVSGKVVASSVEEDMRLQRMLGHVAALSHGQPRSVLIVGLGTGTTAGCFVDHPSIERIVVCEIEPAVVGLARKHFAEENRGVLDDPRTEIVYDDARHFLATTDETFDIITSDPIHPWVKGASALYSLEYYGLVKAHLNPGGVVTQWVPFYETSNAAVSSMLATFFNAFPGGTVWHAGPLDAGNDVVMLGRPDGQPLDLTTWQLRLALDENQPLRDALAEVALNDPVDLFRRLAGDDRGLADWLSDAQVNRDQALRLEYLAGLGRRKANDARRVYHELTRLRRIPPDAAVDEATRRAIEALWSSESLR